MIKNQLAQKLQVWGFEGKFLIFKDLSLGVILEISQKDITCQTDEALNSFHESNCDFLNSLPPNLSLQFVQSIERGFSKTIEEHESLLQMEAPELSKELLEERTLNLRQSDENGDLRSQKLYVLLRKPFIKNIKKKGLKLFSKTEEKDWSREVLEPELKSFKKSVELVKSGLELLSLESRILNEEETFKLLFDQWNPNHPISPPHFNAEDFRDELLLNDLLVSQKGFVINDTHHRVLSLKVMPKQTFSSMSERIRDLPLDSKLFLSIEVLDQDKEDMSLQTQRRISYAMYAGKTGVGDLESAAKLQDLESILEKRVAGETKIFSVSLNVVLRHFDEEVLESQVEEVLQSMRELGGAEGMKESLASTSIFFDLSLPNARSLERSRKMNTENLADFLPLFGDWKGHKTPRVILKNRNSSLVGFDPFSPTLTNFNQIVSGGSGAGKSFLTNLIISQMMKEDPKVFIIDIGGSYKKITENLDGQYIPIGTNSKLSLNPFDLTEKSIEAIDQKIKFMTSLVELMTKEDGSKGIGKLERSEIESFIQEILQTEEFPRLSHLKEKLLKSSEPVLNRFGKILSPWCGDSPFGRFVDQKSNLKMNKKVVCFDLKGLESQPDLQAVCLFLITDFVWREVQRDRIFSKFVVFDECWSLLENEAGSRFLGEVFRTFRKYRASAIAISQTMDDFANSKVSSAILPNASIKWILKQTGGNIENLKEILRFNDREIKLVESLTSKKGKYSESFLVAGDEKQVVLIESTPLEYWLSTTDPADLRAFENEKSPGISDLEILKLLSKKFPNGATL